MFSNLNWWEIIGLALLGLFIFGPERLPKVIADGVRMLRTLRNMARNATNDLSRELGTNVRLEDLHPKTFLRKHLLSEDEEAALRRPFDDIYRDLSHELRRDYWVDPLDDPPLGPGRSGYGSVGPGSDLGSDSDLGGEGRGYDPALSRDVARRHGASVGSGPSAGSGPSGPDARDDDAGDGVTHPEDSARGNGTGSVDGTASGSGPANGSGPASGSGRASGNGIPRGRDRAEGLSAARAFDPDAT